MSSPKDNKLSGIKQRLQGQSKSSIATEYFVLAKELGCLGELLGREFVFTYKKGKIVGFKQQPISIPTFITLMQEFKTYKEMEEKQMKGKGKGRGKR